MVWAWLADATSDSLTASYAMDSASTYYAGAEHLVWRCSYQGVLQKASYVLQKIAKEQ